MNRNWLDSILTVATIFGKAELTRTNPEDADKYDKVAASSLLAAAFNETLEGEPLRLLSLQCCTCFSLCRTEQVYKPSLCHELCGLQLNRLMALSAERRFRASVPFFPAAGLNVSYLVT